MRAEQSPNDPKYPAYRAFDGLIGLDTSYSATHAGKNEPHWLKATFYHRVFISEIKLVNRMEAHMQILNNGLKMSTSVRDQDGKLSVIKEILDLGALGDQKTFQWNEKADVLMIEKPLLKDTNVDWASVVLSLDEVFIHGYILLDA